MFRTSQLCAKQRMTNVFKFTLISMVGDGHEIYEPTSHCRWDDHCPHIVTSLVGGQPWNIQGFLQMKFVRIWEFANVAYMEHMGTLQENDAPPKKKQIVLFVDYCFVLKHSMILRWALLTRRFSILPPTGTRSPCLVFGATSFIGN